MDPLSLNLQALSEKDPEPETLSLNPKGLSPVSLRVINGNPKP